MCVGGLQAIILICIIFLLEGKTVCNKLSPGVNGEIYNDIINVFASDMPMV